MLFVLRPHSLWRLHIKFSELACVGEAWERSSVIFMVRVLLFKVLADFYDGLLGLAAIKQQDRGALVHVLVRASVLR
jgi:hypothetical protein